MGKAVCICSDMIFSTKISGTARAVGCDLVMVNSPERAAEKLEDGADLLIIDLAAAGDGVTEWIRSLRESGTAPRILAYVSHVDTALASAAQEAGADEVLPRSAFSSRLPEILSGV